jgi:hemin uptake protein HemP
MTDPKQAQRETAGVLAKAASDLLAGPVTRINSQELFRQGREVEIEHAGRIYRLRLTQLNKLILTA